MRKWKGSSAIAPMRWSANSMENLVPALIEMNTRDFASADSLRRRKAAPWETGQELFGRRKDGSEFPIEDRAESAADGERVSPFWRR